jgi:hypothetical protein
MGAPVVHWEINARNAGTLREFYSSIFGWSINADNPINYGLVNTGSKRGINGGIAQTDPSSQVPPVIFYVEVPDPQVALEKAVVPGGRIVVPVTEIPDMVTYALFADPDGNTIGVVKAMAIKRRPRRSTGKVP